MRHLATGSRFGGREKDYADFTFHDAAGRLTEYLSARGLTDASKWAENPPTYHLEVKTTKGPRNEPFFMSNNQVDMARRYSIPASRDAIPKDVYVVLRVFEQDVEKTAMHWYLDPWKLFMAKKLSFMARGCFVVSPLE